MDFRGLVSKGVWKIIFFWFEIGSGSGEPGGTSPPRIPRSTPPELEYLILLRVCSSVKHASLSRQTVALPS